MALLTPFPLSEARAALAPQGLQVADIEPLSGGSVNSNFRLTTAAGEPLFARLYEEQSLPGAQAEVALLRALSAAGVPTPSPLVLTEWRGKPVAVFPWVEGEILCQARVTPAACERVGRALARVHLAPVESVPEGRFGAEGLRGRLDRIEREASTELRAAAREIRDKLERTLAERDPSLPTGLIHGDLFRDNVLFAAGEIAALIDFESASLGPYVYDLCVCVHAWCFTDRFEPELAAAMIAGYDALRPLTEAEIRAAPTEAALAALRFATTRITDYSMRAPPGQAPVRDYRRFLARIAAIESGALSPILAGLR